MRHSKRTQDFKYRFMTTRYTEMRRELVDARKIHESLFPEAIEIGELRFTFDYEPMRQIGGDFLFAHRLKSPDGAPAERPLSVVLLDVTGHGIPAALTVNRLHGELERVFAENPDIGPGEVLGLLNRYVHLTLASHSIYLTALCLRVDVEASTLEFASGGHPPAFLRAVDGTVEELVSTSFVLGAASHADYDPAPRTLRFGPGDTVIAYTDGAIEARNDDGKMIRIDGLRRMVASAGGIPPTKWPAAFRHEVTEYRAGPAEDDTLLFVVHRVVGDRARAHRPAPVGAGREA
jgi:sigma-B regulation protein RsbU (phosphoserine phosphatase)